jgi:hypothetical protein
MAEPESALSVLSYVVNRFCPDFQARVERAVDGDRLLYVLWLGQFAFVAATASVCTAAYTYHPAIQI